MNRFLAIACLTLCTFFLGCDIPAPAQYDHAILRDFFGKSPKDVKATFGKPSSIGHTDSCLPPRKATREEQKRFHQTTESMQYVYSTVDGNLVFHFNLNNSVYAITYRGNKVSPPIAKAQNKKPPAVKAVAEKQDETFFPGQPYREEIPGLSEVLAKVMDKHIETTLKDKQLKVYPPAAKGVMRAIDPLNGVQVDLLAVSQHIQLKTGIVLNKGKKWWRPDGTGMTVGLYDHLHGGMGNSKNMRKKIREIVFKVSGIKGRDIGLRTNVTNFLLLVQLQHPVRNYREIKNLNVLLVGFKPEHKSTDIRFGIAGGKWKTQAWVNVPKNSSSTNGLAIIGKPIESKGKVYITATDTAGMDQQARIIAMDKAGITHIGKGTGDSRSAGKMRLTSVRFEKLALKDTAKIKFQTRPYRWIIFKNISLDPGHKTKTSIKIEPKSTVPSAVQPPRVDLKKKYGLMVRLYDRDNVKPGLLARVLMFPPTDHPGPKWLYQQALTLRHINPKSLLLQLSGRMGCSYSSKGKIELAEYFRKGNTITARFRYITTDNEKVANKVAYLCGSLPNDLPPGHYKVVVELAEYLRKGGKIVFAPKTKIRRHEHLTCTFTIPQPTSTTTKPTAKNDIITVKPKASVKIEPKLAAQTSQKNKAPAYPQNDSLRKGQVLKIPREFRNGTATLNQAKAWANSILMGKGRIKVDERELIPGGQKALFICDTSNAGSGGNSFLVFARGSKGLRYLGSLGGYARAVPPDPLGKPRLVAYWRWGGGQGQASLVLLTPNGFATIAATHASGDDGASKDDKRTYHLLFGKAPVSQNTLVAIFGKAMVLGNPIWNNFQRWNSLKFSELPRDKQKELLRTVRLWTKSPNEHHRFWGAQLGMKWAGGIDFVVTALKLLDSKVSKIRVRIAATLSRHPNLTPRGVELVKRRLLAETNVLSKTHLIGCLGRCRDKSADDALWELAKLPRNRTDLWWRAIRRLKQRKLYKWLKNRDWNFASLPKEIQLRMILVREVTIRKITPHESKTLAPEAYRLLPELLTTELLIKAPNVFSLVYRQLVKKVDKETALQAMIDFLRRVKPDRENRPICWSIDQCLKQINKWYSLDFGGLGNDTDTSKGYKQCNYDRKAAIDKISRWYSTKNDIITVKLKSGELVVKNIREDGLIAAAEWTFKPVGKKKPIILGKNLCGMSRVLQAIPSPDGTHLVVVSVGEGHTMLEIIDLPLLLKRKKVRNIAVIDPFPGYIKAIRWERNKLIIGSDMLLTHRITNKTSYPYKRVPPFLMFNKLQRFSFDTATGRITALSADAKKPADYYQRRLKNSKYTGELNEALSALMHLRATTHKREMKAVPIYLSKNGYIFRGKTYRRGDVGEKRLIAAVKKITDASPVTIRIMVNGDTPWGHVVELFKLLTQAGVKDIGFNSPKTKPIGSVSIPNRVRELNKMQVAAKNLKELAKAMGMYARSTSDC